MPQMPTTMIASAPVAQPAQARAAAYQQIGVVTGVSAATPHGLVLMLLDGFDDALLQAAGAMREGAVALKCRAIDRAVRIVDEGLKANLNLADGGRLAADLRDLYGYVSLRLLHANLHNDAAVLDECRRLIRPLREAWVAIGPQAASTLPPKQ